MKMKQTSDPEKPEALDAFHWHEALDRSFICMEMVDRLLLFHPAIESSETFKTKAKQAHQLLFELYQELGRVSIEQPV